MSFARPELIWLAAALPVLVALGVARYAARRARVAGALGDAQLVRRLSGQDLVRFPLRRLLMLVPAAALLGIAAAGPRWGRSAAEGRTSALNVVFAVDISKSMLAADVTPSRLERERLLMRRLLRGLAGDRLGLVVFAGRAYVLSPLTIDHSALNLYLDALDPDIVSQGGSSLAAAITQATDLARGSEEIAGDRAIVLVSDGEALEDEEGVEAAAERAARAGVTVFTVGIGSSAGSPIPERHPDTGEIRGYKRDASGEVVVTRMNESLLRRIADRTGGAFVNIEDAGSADRLLSQLDELERAAVEGGPRSEAPDRAAIFIAIALLLLALDATLPRLRAARREAAAARGAATAQPRRAHARAASFALLWVLLAFGIGDVERGNRLYREGRYEEAVEAYRSAIADGDRSPEVLYNLGTALLQLGRSDEAEQHLRRALEAVDPELRRRAYYNLGNRFLTEGRQSEDLQAQQRLLDGAIDAYKHSLRLDPADADAKWNLELALRERDNPPQSMPQAGQDSQQQDDQQSGGGGGGSSSQDQSSDQPTGAGDQNSMSREQADRILSAVEQDERDLTREKLRKGQRRTPVARDW